MYGKVRRDAADRERRRSIPAAPTPAPRSSATGRRSTTAKPTACSPATASSSTTRSPRRGETFVTRKITRAATRIKEGLQDKLYPGQPGRQARLGLRRRLRRGHVADAPAGRAGRLRRSPPARPTRCASSSRRSSACLGLDWQQVRRDRSRATSARPRSTCCWATRPRPAESWAGQPKVDFQGTGAR